MGAHHRQKGNCEEVKADRLGESQRVLIALAMLSVLLVAGVVIDAGIRGGRYGMRQSAVVQDAGLPDLCLVPPGTPGAAGAGLHPAVDIRHTPFLPFHVPNTAELLFSAPEGVLKTGGGKRSR